MHHLQFAARNVKDKLVKCVRQPSFLPFYLNTYLVKPFKEREPDICFVSYPKCGRTWVMYLLDVYFRETGDSRYKRDSNWFELPTGDTLKFEHGQGNWVPAPPPLDEMEFNGARYWNKNVIFLVRDPRDVLVSSWYHLTYREPIYDKSISEFVREDLVGARKVVEFMNMWIENRDVPRSFMMLRYEGLKSDPHTALRKILEFVDVYDYTDEQIDNAVELSSFENMKKAEQNRESSSPWLNPGRRPVDKAMKVRKGKVGGYRDEMTDEDIEYVNRIIDTYLTDELAEYKYKSA
jgi:hypothetical protein